MHALREGCRLGPGVSKFDFYALSFEEKRDLVDATIALLSHVHCLTTDYKLQQTRSFPAA